MVEAIIFDLDGVITDTAKYHYIAWKELGDKIGIEIDEEVNESLKGISRMESLEKILLYGNKQNEFSNNQKIYMATQKNEYYKSLIKKLTPHDILPGIESLLINIKNKSIKIGLASASKNATSILKNLELMDYFDFIADASKCENGKPAPDIFLMAAKGLGVNPKKCIGIEDASAGVDAINNSGMYSVGVGDFKVLSKANYVVDSTEKLIIENILNEYSK